MLMFLASITTFVLATVIEGTVIARLGVFVHLVFFEYQDVAVADKLPLLDHKMHKFDLICMWASSFEVRVCIIQQVPPDGRLIIFVYRI